MSKMRVALAALHFSPQHTVAAVSFGIERLLLGWSIKAWPPAARIELSFRAKQRLAAAHALVGSGGLGLLILARKGRLGTLLTGYIVLIRRKLFAPRPVVFD